MKSFLFKQKKEKKLEKKETEVRQTVIVYFFQIDWSFFFFLEIG